MLFFIKLLLKPEHYYIGVRSGMADKIIRVSARPPPRFTSSTDFTLWMKRFQLYCEEAQISKERLARELVSLLEDEPFCQPTGINILPIVVH